MGSFEIQPEGKFCTDFDDRFKMEKGDLFDCMDSQKNYYVCTVLDTRITDQSESSKVFDYEKLQHKWLEKYPVKEIQFGYRYYDL